MPRLSSTSYAASRHLALRQIIIDPTDLLAFALGAVSLIHVQVIGRLYLGEVFLLVCALGLPLLFTHLKTSKERWLLTWFFVLGGAYFVGLVATDIYRHTPLVDYARGWARALVYLGDFAGLLVLGYRRRSRLALFVAGTALSQLSLAVLGGWTIDWKFGLAYPVTVGVLVLLDSHRRFLSLASLGLLGLIHLMLDFRIYAALCITVAVLVYFKGSGSRMGSRLRPAVVAAGLAGAFGLLYLSGAGWTQTAYDRMLRRQGSNVERVAGFLVAGEAIRQSPLVGYGSWAKSDEALGTWAELRAESGSGGTVGEIQERALLSPEGATIRAHSMILQAWVEAGLAGLMFFGFQLLVAALMLYRMVTVGPPHRYYALVCFFGLWSLWAFIMSPFSGISRLYAGMSLSLLFVFWPTGSLEKAQS